MSVHVSSNIWRSCPLKHDKLVLMLALADLCTDSGYCYASRKSLAGRVRCSERHVQRILQDLIAAEEIELIQAGGGRGKAPVYLLARYSEGGVLTSFERETFPPERETNRAIKGDKPPSQSVSQRDRNTSTTAFGADVVNIYDAYPRKVARPAALKAIARALKSTPSDKLLELTLAYAKAVAGSDQQFIPHPATWFNQERYNDDPKTWTRSDRRDRTESNRNTGTANEGRSSQYRGVGKVR